MHGNISKPDGDIGQGPSAPPPGTATPAPAAWFGLAIMMIFTIVSLIDRSIIAILTPEIAADLHLNHFQVSLVQGLGFAIFYGIGGVAIGSLVDRHSRRWIMFSGMTIWSLAAAGCGLAANYVHLFAARMMVGAGEGTISPCAQTLIASSFPPNRMSTPMSLFTAAGVAGLAISYGLGGMLLDHLTQSPIGGPLAGMAPWRQVLIITALPGLLVALLAFALREPPLPEGSHDPRRSSWAACVRHMLAHKRVQGGTLICCALTIMMAQGVAAWAPTYARQALGIPAASIGQMMLILVGSGGILGMLGAGAIVDRWSSRGRHDAPLRCLFWAILLGVPVSVAGFLSNDETFLYVGIFAVQLTLFSASGTMFAAVHIVTPPGVRGRTSAIMVFIVNLAGYGLGPMFVGGLTDYVYQGEEHVGTSIATLLLVFGVLTALLTRYIQPYYGAHVAAAQGRNRR